MNSPEFALAVAACRAEYGGGPSSLPDGPVDWQRLVALCRRHRIQGIVHSGLAKLGIEVPSPQQAVLAADAQQILATNLALAAECQSLLRAFESADIPLLFVKGLSIAALAYPNPFLKMGWDIDILIAPDRLDQAIPVLIRLGYVLVTPQHAVQRWHVRHKESVWQRGASNVELHTRLADSPQLIPGIDASSPRQTAVLPGGIELPTLADDFLFTYLAVHGAWSAWFRLKWLSDFAAFIHGRSAGEVDRLYDRSLELGAGRCAAQALLLAHEIFETPLSGSLRTELARDGRLPLLLALARRQLSGRKELGEPTEVPFGTATIHLSELFLLPGLRFKVTESFRQFGDRISAAGFA